MTVARDIIYTVQHRCDWSSVKKDIAEKYRKAAKYFVEDDVVGIIQREDAFSSIKALVEAGVCRLPYNPMVLEFQATDKFRWLILLEEVNEGEKILAQAIFLHLPTDTTIYSAKDIDVFMDGEGFAVFGVGRNQDAHAIICAVTMALLFLNTKGIEKKYIEPVAFNKARAKKGRPQAPGITVLRIGTVYGRNGEAVGGGVPGMRKVHLRAGHTRRQHYGPGNEQVKIVYIPPVLVNYRPEQGGAMPELPTKRVKL